MDQFAEQYTAISPNMSADQFAEQLVKKHRTTEDDLKKALLIAGTVILTLLTLYVTFFIAPIAVVLPVGIIYLAIYLFKLLQVEYEYSCTNGVLDIDKIMGQVKRTPMLSVAVSSFTEYGRADNYEGEDGITVFSAVGTSLMHDADAQTGATYYAVFDHPEHGKCCLLFNPDARMRGTIERFLSRTLKKTLNS